VLAIPIFGKGQALFVLKEIAAHLRIPRAVFCLTNSIVNGLLDHAYLALLPVLVLTCRRARYKP